MNISSQKCNDLEWIISKDSEFLKEHNLIDYSLLLMVETYKAQSKRTGGTRTESRVASRHASTNGFRLNNSQNDDMILSLVNNVTSLEQNERDLTIEEAITPT